MAEEKEVTQEAQAEQPEAEVETPGAEDLQKQIEELTADRKRLEQTVSKHAAEEQKLRGQVGSFTTLADRQDRVEEQNALMLDYLEELRGTSAEPAQTISHSSKLEQQRKEKAESEKAEAEKSKPQTEADSEEVEAFYMAKNLMNMQGWDMEHPAVVKTKSMSSPKEALRVLQKAAKEENDRRINETIQQQLKASGLTGAPPSGPSAQNTSFENVRDTYIKNPNDPAIAREYYRLRQERGI